MKTKQEIASDWLPRYTGMKLEEFGEYILLVNFNQYIKMFCEKFEVKPANTETAMQAATWNNITIINFGMGSSMAATAMDLLSSISPKACLFLGKCGGLKKKTQMGDLILPIAAIRGEETSKDYFNSRIPALPAFALQRAVSSTIIEHNHDYWTGTVYTTNRRLWEHDERFKEYLRSTRAMAIDMETATLFIVGFANEIPCGALLLVSDNPMIPEGVKTAKKDREISQKFAGRHLEVGLDSLLELENSGESVKHLMF